jgi:hypothetical protein
MDGGWKFYLRGVTGVHLGNFIKEIFTLEAQGARSNNFL